MTFNPTGEQCQRGLLVHLETKEMIERMKREGFAFEEIICGLGPALADFIAGERGTAKAAEWFAAMPAVIMSAPR
jgi:hypothetical protein